MVKLYPNPVTEINRPRLLKDKTPVSYTHLLAYIGSSLTTVLLYASYQASLEQLLNRELIIVELLQALSGSIGILCTIPISAFIASGLCCMKKRAVKKEA